MELLIYILIAINLFTFILFGIDKLKAKRGKWRIEEKTLLIATLAGGSIGALLGMKIFHHKTQHKKFKYFVPFILILHLIIAGVIIYKGR